MLGTELKDKLIKKAQNGMKKISSSIDQLNIRLNELIDIKNSINTNTITEKSSVIQLEIDGVKNKLLNLQKELKRMSKIIKEADRMKDGSIALVNQITTISKIRIYDPKSQYDVLNGIKISTDNLDAINNKIKEQFVYF